MIEVQCILVRWWTENTNHVVSAWIVKLFERRREIPRERLRLAKLSSTRRGSKGRRIPWSVGYQGETGKGLMKTKVGTKGRWEAYASTSISASSPRGISDRARCLFAGSFPRSRNFPLIVRDGEKLESKAYRCRFLPRPPLIIQEEVNPLWN